jgi:ubiquinone biosynthesis monooxygenase Coq7
LPPERAINSVTKVNHAGEHGAAGIYLGQILTCRLANRRIVPELTGLLAHERVHLQVFDRHWRSRSVTSCRVLHLWRVGGFVLGVLTVLLGTKAIATCTSAVESVVVSQLEHQILYLEEQDPDLANDIRKILIEEEDHLVFGQSFSANWFCRRVLAPSVRAPTEAVIWTSMRL